MHSSRWELRILLVGLAAMILVSGSVSADPDPDQEDQIGPTFSEAADKFKNTKWNNAMFWYSRSELAGDTPPGFTVFTFMLSHDIDEQSRMHMGLYYGRGESVRRREFQEGLRWVSEGGIEFGARGYVTPAGFPMKLYGMAGVRVGGLLWSHTEAVMVMDEDGDVESISHNAVLCSTPYIGLGVTLVKTEDIHLGANLTVGYRIAKMRTYHDCENDLFKNVWEYKLNFEIGFY